jgi:hypothetical protein
MTTARKKRMPERPVAREAPYMSALQSSPDRI